MIQFKDKEHGCPIPVDDEGNPFFTAFLYNDDDGNGPKLFINVMICQSSGYEGTPFNSDRMYEGSLKEILEDYLKFAKDDNLSDTEIESFCSWLHSYAEEFKEKAKNKKNESG